MLFLDAGHWPQTLSHRRVALNMRWECALDLTSAALKAIAEQQMACREEDIVVSENEDGFFQVKCPGNSLPRTFIWVVESFTTASWKKITSVG